MDPLVNSHTWPSGHFTVWRKIFKILQTTNRGWKKETDIDSELQNAGRWSWHLTFFLFMYGSHENSAKILLSYQRYWLILTALYLCHVFDNQTVYLCLADLFKIKLFICIKMDLALNNLQRLTWHKTQTVRKVKKILHQLYRNLYKLKSICIYLFIYFLTVIFCSLTRVGEGIFFIVLVCILIKEMLTSFCYHSFI